MSFCTAWGSPRRRGCAGDFGAGQGEDFPPKFYRIVNPGKRKADYQ